jgi:hypothetical protein
MKSIWLTLTLLTTAIYSATSLGLPLNDTGITWAGSYSLEQ